MSQSQWFDQTGDDEGEGRGGSGDSGPGRGDGSGSAGSAGHGGGGGHGPFGGAAGAGGPRGPRRPGPGGGGRPPVPTMRLRRRGPLVPTLVILFVLAILLSWLAQLWTDVLWYDSVGFRQVFTTELFTKIGLFLVGGALTGAVVWSSLHYAYRSRPIYAPVTQQQQTLDQYREAIEPVRKVAMIGIPVVLGLLAGTGAAGQWQHFLLWRNAVSFGQVDPQFHKDISFFVFTLPWLQFVLGFLTMVLIMAIVAAAVTHYVYGGIQLQGRGQRTTRAARIHLAVLLAAVVLVHAGSEWVGRYALATQDSRLMTGITYTDAHAVMPTKAILAVASLMCAAMFVASIWTRSWRLPVVGIGLLVVTSIVAGGIYPALIQGLKVGPSEKSLEQPYIARSISATRAAYGLDQVDTSTYEAQTSVSAGQLRQDAQTVPGIRIIDPNVVSPTFRQLQALRQYYAVPDTLDVDRYTIDGKTQDSVVSVRELDLGGVPAGQRNWLNDHTVYTHGYGFIAAYGTQRTDEGDPVFFERDLQPTKALGNFEPRIYFGEQSPLYSIVGGSPTSQPGEFDYPDQSTGSQKNTTYTGSGGVAIGSLGRKLAYAVKYRELKFILSNAVKPQSRLLDHRSPLERVERVAPWLTPDGNPYPAIVGGRIQWIVDGYTTSASYPYSRLQDLANATSDSVTERSHSVGQIQSGQVNYIRNSVKATVDAYDGSVHLYSWDDKDPVLKAWSKVFPGSVEPMSKMSGDLMAHVRYPQDLFKIQRAMLTKYHVVDANSFYGGQDYWRVPKDPTSPGQDQPVYYLSLAMPGQKQPKFSLTTTFIPVGQKEVLTGFLAVDGDAGKQAGQRSSDYGKLRLLVLPRDAQVNGPGQVENQIEISTTRSASSAEQLNLSQFIAQNRTAGKQLTVGNLLTLPVGGGLLYVQPLYVSASNESGSYPQVKATVVVFGNRIAWAPTLDSALDGLFGGNSGASAGDSGTTPAPSTTTTQKPGTGGSTGAHNAALAKAIQQIQQAYADGQQALKNGDFAAYGEAQKRMAAAIKAAVAAAPKGASATVTPSPSPTTKK